MQKRVFFRYTYLLLTLFVLALFGWICYCTPLAGDDWGYALNGRSGQPFHLAWQFYQNWSGRFFSELWGFVVAPRKWLWNFLNPLLFTVIYLALYKLGRIRRHPVLSALLLLAGILSVDDQLRMETYSWLMGSTYVVPLAVSAGYFWLVDSLFQEDFPGPHKRFLAYLVNIPLFIAGMMMENISFAMVLACLAMSGYAYFQKPRLLKYLLIHGAVCLLAFILLRIAPGASARLYRDSAAWAALPLWKKMLQAYPNFLETTFIHNNYAIGLLALSLSCVLLWGQKKQKGYRHYWLLIPQMMAVFTVFSFVIFPVDHFLLRGNSIYSMFFWPLYSVLCFLTIYISMEEEYYCHKTLFLLAFAGINAFVMLASPIYGPRSSLYTVFYILEVCILVLDSIEVDPKFLWMIALIFLGIIIDRSHEYITKYRWVRAAQQERQEILLYYRKHPEVKEAWIPRFPIYTTHGSDIELDDIYHLETFKEYYQLPQAADKIIFFAKDS